MILIFAVRMKLIEWKGSYCSNEITIKKLYDYFEDGTSGTSGTSG